MKVPDPGPKSGPGEEAKLKLVRANKKASPRLREGSCVEKQAARSNHQFTHDRSPQSRCFVR